MSLYTIPRNFYGEVPFSRFVSSLKNAPTPTPHDVFRRNPTPTPRRFHLEFPTRGCLDWLQAAALL